MPRRRFSKYDFDLTLRGLKFFIAGKHFLLSNFFQSFVGKGLIAGPDQQIGFVRVFIKNHPCAVCYWTRLAIPAQSLITNFHLTNVVKEKERNGTLAPVLKILLDFFLSILILYFNNDPSFAESIHFFLKPVRFSETTLMEANGKRRGKKLDGITKTESALEADSPEADGVQGSFI